jgi:uncharacterized protein (TIGR03435 family)
MTALFAGMNQMAAAGVAALLNTLWYAGAVVGLTWAILRYAPRVNAATRYWIWTGVLASLLVFPSLPSLAGHVRMMLERREQATPAIPLATVAAAPASVSEFEPVRLTLPASPGSQLWPLWLLAAWMFAAVWQLTRLAGGVRSVQRLKARAGSHGERLPSPWASQTHDEFKCGIRRGYQLLASGDVTSPVAVGYRHPAIILPPDLLEQLDEGEKRDVLLHELAHLARYDDWLNLATRALGAILVLHPLVAIVMKQIEREREMACDDFVVAHTGSVRHYARSLARLHDLRWSTGTRLLAAGLLGQNSSLGDRIESLLRRGRKFSAQPSLKNLGVSALFLALLLAAGGLIPSWIAIAQTSKEPQNAACEDLPKSFCANLPNTFEVASIRPANSRERVGTSWGNPNGRFLTSNLTVSRLIQIAYQIMPEQLEGVPHSMRSRGYTIQAEAPPEWMKERGIAQKLPPTQREQAHSALNQSWHRMARALLADRFKLKVHRQTRLLPVYELVVTRGGPKLKPTGKLRGVSTGAGYVRASGISMGDFAAQLSQWISRDLGRLVIDKTGLTGNYDFTLKWTPWQGGERRTGFGQTTGFASSSGPSIFTAIQQQLGLELKAAKGPVEVLVVDHVEPPTPN